MSRVRKIVRISQAHVAPGMSLELWRDILRRHAVSLDKAQAWDAVPDEIIEAIWQEIAGIVQSQQTQQG